MVEPSPQIHLNLSFKVPCSAKIIHDTNSDGTNKKHVNTDIIRVKESKKLEDIIGDVGKKGLKIEVYDIPNMSQSTRVIAVVEIGTTKDRSKSAHHNKTLKSYADKEHEFIDNWQDCHEYNRLLLNQPHHENRIKILKNDANNPSGVTKPINVNYHWSVIQIIVEPPPPIH